MIGNQTKRSELATGRDVIGENRSVPHDVRESPNYSFMNGEFQFTVLSDGFVSVPGDIALPDLTSAKRERFLARLDTEAGAVKAKANIPLVRVGDEVILVDIGSGNKYQPSDGRLFDNLARAGVAADSITKVVFTHAHPDHIWATITDDGHLRFPNATYFVGASEWDFWMDPDYLTSMPAAVHDFARGSRRDLCAIKDRVVMLKPGDDVVPGIRAVDTAGHTPGHLSFEVDGSEGMIIAADVATNEIISFEHPDWRFGFDMIPELAIRNRKRFIDRAAFEGTKLLGYHWTYPGLGYAERIAGGFRFTRAL